MERVEPCRDRIRKRWEDSLDTGPSALGIVCCDSRLVWLSTDPVRLPYRYAQTKDGFKPVGYRCTVLPNQPGKYPMYITTQRVFPRDYQYTT